MAAGAIVAVAGLSVLTACGSSSGKSSAGGATLPGLSGAGMYGSLPAAASGTEHTGTIKIGELSGFAINYILPIPTAATGNIYNDYYFDYLMYRPLYWLVDGSKISEDKSLSLANDPVWSSDDKTVTISLKSNYKWSDGTPVTSKDILFWYDEMQAAVKESPANYAYFTPNQGLTGEVSSITTPNASTAVFHLTQAVNPTWFWEDELGSIEPMPAHAWAIDSTGGQTLDYTNPANAKKIYDYLNSSSKSLGTYTSNPIWQVVDGPYHLTAYNSTSFNFSMAPNPKYGGPHASGGTSPIQVTFYTTDEAEYNALKAGAVDLGWIPEEDVPEAASVSKTYTEWGYPGFGWQGIILNFADKTGSFDKIIGQTYIRQDLQRLINQPGIVKAYLHGAGAVSYGIAGAYPASQFSPADAINNPFPYSPTTAASNLKAHGWTIVPNGSSYCSSPGTGSNECGAGIAKGATLSWNLIYGSTPTITQEMVTNFASVAASLGIKITLKADSTADITSDENDVATPSNDSKWAMSDFGGFTNSTYPTTQGLFNSGASFNMGDFQASPLNTLVNNSIGSSDPAAVKNELSYVSTALPVLFQPNPDWDGNDAGIMAINKAMSGPPDSFANYSQYALTPEFWFFKK
ncbi:MAG TPA: ABC transporter substrate-binding protein [Streptosporangiaceae bacterium]|jgi:peptide/nickel transport system substrate-binding protein